MELHTDRGGLCTPPPPNFFKILNSRYIFKILENKPKKNLYLHPSRKLYLPLLSLNPSSVPDYKDAQDKAN